MSQQMCGRMEGICLCEFGCEDGARLAGFAAVLGEDCAFPHR